MRALFAPSLMCLDYLDLRSQLSILDRRADFLHVDVMDGHFCKNLMLSPDLVRTFASVTTKPIEVHLMTTTPNDWIEPFAQAGAAILSPHAEAINVDAFRTLRRIESLGCKCGAVLNPATPLCYAEAYLDMLDMLTLMTVDVGYAGQKFIPQMLRKVEQAREAKEKHGYKYLIQIDGGCGPQTYRALHEAGAEAYVMGSSGLFGKHPDLDTAYSNMLAQFEEITGFRPEGAQ